MLERVWREGTLLHCWWECKFVQPLWRTLRRFLKKLKIELLYDPTVSPLSIFPEKNMIWKDTCTPTFTAELFAIAKTWKQSTCLPTEGWINKLRYIYIRNRILLSHLKEQNNVTCGNTDGPRECHPEWRKSDREREILSSILYVECKKKWFKWTEV